MLGLISVLSFLAFSCSLVASVYFTYKVWRYRSTAHGNYLNDDEYIKLKKRREMSWVSIPIIVVIFMGIEGKVGKELKEKEILIKAENYVGGDKEVFEKKFAEYSKTMKESTAREKAVIYTDKIMEMNERINGLEGEDKQIYLSKFEEYKKEMDDISAKEKALNAMEKEIVRRNKELQKKYDDQKQYEEWIAWQEAEKEKTEKAELQKKYDDQKKYEEWIAWQEAEKEKAEKAELQKKYDDQKKYEEWMAWKKSEEEKKQKAEEKKRAGLTELERAGKITYYNIGNDSYNVVITDSINLTNSAFERGGIDGLLNMATHNEHERNAIRASYQCMKLVETVKEANVNVNQFTINLRGTVTDMYGNRGQDNVVICEIGGGTAYTHGDPYDFYNKCSRFWMINGM